MAGLVTVVLALVAMEGVSYLTHRFVMHGFGIGLHRSHHARRRGTFEANDLYPMMFSSVAVMTFAFGSALPSLRLLEVGGGITLYGASYLFVHEVYIHRRLALLHRPLPVLEWLKSSHRVHHLYGGEPYGMLLPVVPRELRRRAAASSADPFAERPQPARQVTPA